MQHRPNNDEYEVDLIRVVGILWHRKWLLLIVGALGAAAAGLITYFTATPLYESTALLLPTAESRPVVAAFLDSDQLRDPPIEAIARLTAFAYRMREPYIHLTGRAHTTESAQAGITRVIEELRSYLHEEYRSPESKQIEIYKRELEPLTALLDKLSDEPDIGRMGSDWMTSYFEIKHHLAELEIRDAMSRQFQVVRKPTRPGRPVGHNVTLNAAAGFVLCFVASAGILLVRQSFEHGRFATTD